MRPQDKRGRRRGLKGEVEGSSSHCSRRSPAAESMASPARRPHVMLVAFGAQGHLNPTLQFGARLAAKGVDVTLASTQGAREWMLSARRDHDQAAASITATPHQVGVEIEFFSDGYDHGAGSPFVDLNLYMEQLGAAGPPNLTELILELGRRGRPVTCLINNPTLPWVLDVGDQLAIPCATLWIQSCALGAMYYAHYQNPSRFEEIGSHLTIAGLPPIRTDDVPSLVRPDNPYPIFIRLLADYFEKKKSSRWEFANTVADLESEIIETVAELQRIKPVGPLVPVTLLDESKSETCSVRADLWAAEPDCLDWLDRQPDNSVIYIALGSYATLPPEQMSELAWGLKSSKARFLWVAKPERGESDVGLPQGFVEETSDQGRVVTWCLQTNVLKHKALAGFLTHCGWNSTLETLSAGVPVIAYPQWTDQPTNAKFLVDVYKVGIRLQVGPNGLVSRDEFQRCITALMAGETATEMRKNALRWKSLLRTAAADGGSSDRNIQQFVDELVSLTGSAT